MKKSVKLIAMILFVMFCMGGSVWAGNTFVHNGAANTAYGMSLEALGANRAIALNAAGAANGFSVEYQLSGGLTSAQVLRLQANNGLAFAAGTYRMCAQNGFVAVGAGDNLDIGTRIANTGDTTVDLVVDLVKSGGTELRVRAGDSVFVTTGDDCNAANSANLNMLVGTSAATVGFKTLTAGVMDATRTNYIDSASTNNAVNVIREYVGTATQYGMTIDYLGTASNDGFRFVTYQGMNTVAANNVALSVTRDMGLNYHAAATNPAMPTANLTSRMVLTVADESSGWQGVTRVYLTGNNDCGIAGNLVGANTFPTNTLSFDYPSVAPPAGFNGGNLVVPGGSNIAANVNLCIEVPGNVSLSGRTITGSYDIIFAGGSAVQPGAQNVTWQNWNVNGYQAFVPHMRFGDTTRTFIRLVNNGTRDAVMSVDLLWPDGSANRNVSLAAIPAGETLTYSAQAIAASAGITDTSGDFAALFLARTTRDSMFADSYFTLLSGSVWTTRETTVYDGQRTNLSFWNK